MNFYIFFHNSTNLVTLIYGRSLASWAEDKPVFFFVGIVLRILPEGARDGGTVYESRKETADRVYITTYLTDWWVKLVLCYYYGGP